MNRFANFRFIAGTLLIILSACGGGDGQAIVSSAAAAASSSAKTPLPQGPASDSIALAPGVPILIDASEPAALQRAALDLQRDLKKVLGAESRLVHDRALISGRPALVITSQGSATASYRPGSLPGAESHAISLVGGGSEPRVVLRGDDVLGAIYAVYTFSDRFLDIPPLWYWASWQPASKSSILVPKGFNLVIAAADVRWRAWFPNDTDLLSPWLASSSEHLDALLETLLRLKFNTLDVNSIRDFPAADQGLVWARASKARGLAITFTHLAPFGANPADWNAFWTQVKGRTAAPARRLSDPASLDTFWNYYIELARREGLTDVVQSIAFRGAGDRGFWVDFADAPADDAARAMVIQEMLRHEITLLRSATGDPSPRMRTVFYNEVANFVASGLLTPPQDPGLIWNYSAQQRDHYPFTDLMSYSSTSHPDRAIGYYMNLNFYTTGSHLVAGEGPWKIEKNIRTASTQAGASHLNFVELNVGNVREFLLELAAGSQMLWNLESFDSDRFLDDFCVRYFGPDAAAAVATLYHGYYESYWEQKRSDFPGAFPRQYIFQDLRYARAAEDLLGYLERMSYTASPLDQHGPSFYRVVPVDSAAPDELTAVIKGTDAAMKRLQPLVRQADALQGSLEARAQPLFNDDLRQQLHFMLMANSMLNSLAKALAAVPEGPAAVKPLLAQASTAVDGMQAALDQRQQAPEFAGWYQRESKFGLHALGARVKHLVAGS